MNHCITPYSIMLAAITAVVLFVSGCEKAPGEDNTYEPIVLSAEQGAMVTSGNTFALSLLGRVDAEEDGNYMISPMSIQFVLGMLLNGASPEAAEEIIQVLGFKDNNVATVNDFFGRLINEMPYLDKKTQVTTARSVLSSIKCPLSKTYISAVSSNYSALCESVDFSKSAAVREKVNTWCAQHTNGMIKEMITKEEESSLSNYVALLLDATCLS